VNDSRGLAPEGWHIPDEAEWKELEDSLGGYLVVGGKLKANILWNLPNTGATDETEFSAIPGGIRTDYGEFYGIGDYICLWTLSEGNHEDAWTRVIFYDNLDIHRNYYSKLFAMSVRCVKDYNGSDEDYDFQNHSNFDIFWKDFKKAVLVWDKNAVLKMTTMPFIDALRDVYDSWSGKTESLTSKTAEEFLCNYDKIFNVYARKTIRVAEFQTFGEREYENYPVKEYGLYKITDDAYLLYTTSSSYCGSYLPNMFIFEKIDGVFKLSSIPYQV